MWTGRQHHTSTSLFHPPQETTSCRCCYRSLGYHQPMSRSILQPFLGLPALPMDVTSRHGRAGAARAFSSSSSATNNNSNEEAPPPSSSSEDASSSDSLPPLPHGSQPLGRALPTDEHACSVSLPTWQSVVGYEEGDASITTALRCGYPRFVYHPYVLQLMEYVVQQHGSPQEDCLVLPSAEAALRCCKFLQASLEGRKGSSLIDNALIGHNDNQQDEPPSETEPLRLSVSSSSSSSSSSIRRVDVGAQGVQAVLFPAETAAGMEAKAYWQHTGEVVSSRRAERTLMQLGQPIRKRITSEECGAPYVCHSASADCRPIEHQPEDSPPVMSDSTASYGQLLRERIAKWARVPSEKYVFLTPSGMASIYAALRSARRYQIEEETKRDASTLTAEHPDHSKPAAARGGVSVVFGFPYLDTLKLCSRSEICPAGVEFFGRGDEDDMDKLEHLLKKSRRRDGSQSPRYCALFTEVPSNPLLQCPDLLRLRRLADEYNFCLVVDDTISNWLNADLIENGIADAVCSSLTKLVSGRGDVMAGSVVVNPNTEKGRWMQKDLEHHYSSLTAGADLYEPDARALWTNSSDFAARNARINAVSEGLADWLADHADVQTVYYPKFTAPLYRQVQVGDGFGGLVSIILEPHVCQRTFYDALDVAKGPSLGTNFTLVCPYTLLAHYHELDFAMNYNVAPNLLRIAVGMEPVEELQGKFEQAFSQARLYPKPTISMPQQSSSSHHQLEQKRSFSVYMPRHGSRRATSIRQMQSVLQRLVRLR